VNTQVCNVLVLLVSHQLFRNFVAPSSRCKIVHMEQQVSCICLVKLLLDMLFEVISADFVTRR